MRKVIAAVGCAAMLLNVAPAWAGEKTVTLSVDNMSCVTCPYIVERTLADVSGVSEVKVFFEEKIAVVTFDDTLTDVAALTKATASVGFPSRPLRQGG